MNDQQLSDYFKGLEQRLISLGQQLNATSNDFSHTFDSESSHERQSKFDNLEDLRWQAAAYRRLRWDSKAGEIFATRYPLPPEINQNSSESFTRLLVLLDDVAAHGGGLSMGDEWFSSWQNAMRAFTSFMKIETAFLDATYKAMSGQSF